MITVTKLCPGVFMAEMQVEGSVLVSSCQDTPEYAVETCIMLYQRVSGEKYQGPESRCGTVRMPQLT